MEKSVYGMSVALTVRVAKSEDMADLFPALTSEERRQLKQATDAIRESIIIPIIEAESKESAVKDKVDQYFRQLGEALVPILQKVIRWATSPTILSNLYAYLRGEIRKGTRDDDICIRLLRVTDIFEEHDRYMAKILPNWGYLASILEKLGLRDYLNAFGGSSLSLIATLISMDVRPEAVRDLSLLAKFFSDELEPFVANLQISMEPELATLRKRTSEEDIEKAKELRGSIFEL